MVCEVERYRWAAFGKLFFRCVSNSAKCLCTFMTLRTLEYSCLVGSIALIGADRIDLLGGTGSFRLPPFLFLAALGVFLRLVIIAVERGLFIFTTPPVRRQMPFLVVLVVFLFLSSISTIFGLDPSRGLMQLTEVVLVSVLGYCVSVQIVSQPAAERLIFRAVSLGLVLHLVFCIGQCIAWAYGFAPQDVDLPSGSGIATLFAPSSSLFWIPRFSGPAIDPNDAGFTLVMYLVLLDAFVIKSRYTRVLRFAIAIFVLMSLSRSALLCLLAYFVFSRAFWGRLSFRRTVPWLVAPAVLCSLLWVTHKNEIMDLVELWQVSDMISDRLSTGEGSSGGDHVQLIKRGIETWSSSTRTMITGIGFGAEPRILSDFFGDDKHGNFHCLYVTVLAGLGLPAFILLMVILGYPIVAKEGATPGIAAIATFSLPYQAHTSPMFWLILAVLWASKPKLRRQPGVAPEMQ
jgi:hypothetical protein